MDDFATITQKRMTGGFRFNNLAGKNIHIDPGPGALVRSYQFKLNPMNLNGIIVTHAHTDHYNDAEILIEAFTKGMTKSRGRIFGSTSVIKGYNNCGPAISKYHLSKSKYNILKPNTPITWDDITIKPTKTSHGDPTCVGVQLKTKDITISYTSDTGYFPQLNDYHKGADVLIANVIRPSNERIKGHMCIDDFKKLVINVSPKLAIISHMGMKLLWSDLNNLSRELQEGTNTNVLIAKDGMKVDLGRFKK